MGNQASMRKTALLVGASTKNNTSKAANDLVLTVTEAEKHEEVPSGSSRLLQPKAALNSSLRKKPEKVDSKNFSRSKSLGQLAEDPSVDDSQPAYIKNRSRLSARKPRYC